ncbi:hypothetical protein HRR83_009166 [Exophiala dermatitidis]|nr:hypothetical protein HRR73_008627 [Exophiala dermatitidis]KAJ4530765.1 hypothetical protein HRR76_008462 [Exophiala dermatitidis]KAJ4531720.1 hypothetical protein HRR77_009265 [Exophiala dermatitidis]KAJ4556784.1 hypothetical protein HRR79_008956 [Exophiala dermatitidis]KAJ4586997.1 hypothetical protein HRR83_009166 [Exophiala dermatitidis]
MHSDLKMSPIAWLFIALFASIILIICLVYLYALKIRRDKQKQARKAEGDEIFGAVIANPIITR